MGTGQSNVTTDRASYRNVVFTGIVTERFNQTLIFGPGEADPMYSRFHIQFSSYLHWDQEGSAPWENDSHFLNITDFPTGLDKEPPALSDNPNSRTDSQEKLFEIEMYLSKPFGPFAYWSNGQILLEVGNRAYWGGDTQHAGDPPEEMLPDILQDVDNGPKPVLVDVAETSASDVYRVRFGITFCIAACEVGATDYKLPKDIEANPPAEDIESIHSSWSYIESKDQKFWSTKTLTGSIRVRNRNDWVHNLRWLIVPPLQNHYQRQAQRFVQSEDRLTLEFTVTDRQRYASPPAPAVDWDCRYSAAFTGPIAVWKMETVSIRLDGAPGTTKSHLTKTAFEIVRAIIPYSMDPNKRPRFQAEPDLQALKIWPKTFLHYAQIVDHVSAESIELIITFRTQIESKKDAQNQVTVQNLMIDNIGVFPQIKKNDGTPDPHNRFIWPAPGLFDSEEPTGIFTHYLQTPCTGRHGLTKPHTLTPAHVQPQGDTYALGDYPEVWGTSEPIQPEDYDEEAATNLEVTTGVGQENDTLTGEMRFPVTEIELTSDYQEHEGVVILPKANSAAQPPTIDTFNFRAPVLYRVSRAVLSRVGAWPRMPKPTKTLSTGDATEKLTDYRVAFEDPRPEDDARTPTYRAHALMTYAIDRSILDMERLRTGRNVMYDWAKMVDQYGSAIDVWNLPYNVNPAAILTDDLFGGDLTAPEPP